MNECDLLPCDLWMLLLIGLGIIFIAALVLGPIIIPTVGPETGKWNNRRDRWATIGIIIVVIGILLLGQM